MSSMMWYTLSPKSLHRAYSIIQIILKDPFLNQTQISSLTKIPRPTVCRIINKLAEVGAIHKIVINVAGNRAYKYEINPEFLDFLSKNLSTDAECSLSKLRGFPAHTSPISPSNPPTTNSSSNSSPKSNHKNSTSPKRNSTIQINHQIITKPDNQDELKEWCRNGFFRIHGFQRKFKLLNYRFTEIDEKWERLALLIDGKLTKQRIGRKGTGACYIINVFSQTFRAFFSLQFRSNSLIVTLPKKKSIYIPWDRFNNNIEQKIVSEINMLVSKAMTAYSEVFKQQVLAKDLGWVGRRKCLRPEVGYLDPDGVVRKVYEANGSTYIEGLGYWIDGSFKSNPEIEFDSIEETSNFKKAVDMLASGEIHEKFESLTRKLSEIEEIMTAAIAKGVEVATQQLATSMLSGVRSVQDQLNEMWKRIAEMQETMNLMLMYQIARENGDEAMKKTLMSRLKQKVMGSAGSE